MRNVDAHVESCYLMALESLQRELESVSSTKQNAASATTTTTTTPANLATIELERWSGS